MAFARQRSHHSSIALSHSAVDAALYLMAFYIGAAVRFFEPLPEELFSYLPALVLGGITMSSVLYVLGMYSVSRLDYGRRWNLTMVLIGISIGLLITLAIGSAIFWARVGRGVLLGALPSLIPLILAHHYLLQRKLGGNGDRCAILIMGPDDEAQARWLENLGKRAPQLAGVVLGSPFIPSLNLPILGRLEEPDDASWTGEVRRLICTNSHFTDHDVARDLRSLRFHGVEPVALTTVFEEALHAVPLELIDPWWLFNAGGQADMLYIRKFKRLFDVFVSTILLVLASPLLLAAVIAVRLTSKGPVFYQQTRSGRLGTTFTCQKIRTMTPDAERHGAKWSGQHDPRVTRIGRYLRKFRIDEVPQLLNVLRGDMSFVGPRPERPEFVEQLAEEIPFYRERLLVQPGLTGWAQVNYPYGSNTEDARYKLEYDLYYIKHMSLVLDLFILLDTVRIVLTGGVSERTSATLRRVVKMIREDTGTIRVSPGKAV